MAVPEKKVGAMNDSATKGGGDFRFFHAMMLIVLLALLPACGGGGGGVDVTPPDTNLDYVLGPPRAGVAALTVTGPLSKFTLSSNPPILELPVITGTFDTATLDTTIADNITVPILWADTVTPSDNSLFGNLEVFASQPFRWNGASDPTAGEFLITSRNGFFPGRIRARVTTAGGGGVQIAYDDNADGTYGPDVFYAWGSFHDLWTDDLKPIHERASSFVYSMRQTIYSLMDLSMETTNAIEDHRAELQAAGSDNAIQVECDALPGALPGSYSIVWTDVNGNGQIDFDLSGAQEHDTFTFTIDQCWIDDPSDPEDLLLDGVLGLNYYEPHLQWGPVFDNLVVTPTLDNVAVPGSAMTVNGGFSLFIAGY
jgi:hypothetical protein